MEGTWYFVTWSFSESHYYDDHGQGKDWDESKPVFIKNGGSIAKFVLEEYRRFIRERIVYCQEERGMGGYGVSCSLKELSLLTPDGRKITGFRPKSIKHLFIDEEENEAA